MIAPQSIDSVLLLSQPRGNWGCIVKAMKPGAHLLLLSSVKEHHVGAIRAEDAGLEIRDTLVYVFADRVNDVGMTLVTLARKPLEGTVAENTLRWGTGGLNIDGCRVDLNGDYKCKPNGRPSLTGLGDKYNPAEANKADTVGRWPANLTHDGSCRSLALFPKVNKQGKCKTDDKSGWQSKYVGGALSKPVTRTLYLDDDNGGSASRFFYSAPCLNNLCSYLIRLVTPLEGTVLTDCNVSNLPCHYRYLNNYEN